MISGSLDRRASRITGASPLVGRGLQRYTSLELPLHDDDDDNYLGGATVSSSHTANDFQLYGPAAGVSTQTASESQWMKATLDQESSNFLDFLKAELAAKIPTGPEEAADDDDDDDDELAGDATRRAQHSVFFEDLLPPVLHTRIVAAQALHHVLALATRGFVNVWQEEVRYGPIGLGVALEV